jgi:hypothetical protein
MKQNNKIHIRKMKKAILLATLILTTGLVNAQSVKQKDKYGSSVVYVYVDGSTLN